MLTAQRLLPLEKGINFRELGGYDTKRGQHVQFHKLIRSAKLSDLSDKDLTYLRDYGLAIDVDFRSQKEKDDEPDKITANTIYRHIPVFSVDETQSSKSPEELQEELRSKAGSGHEQMIQVYKDMINHKGSQKAYRRFFQQLLENDQPNHALLFHCTAGKDRTGMGAYFILSALEVDHHTIEQDYLLTNQAAKAAITDRLSRVKAMAHTQELLDNIQALSSVHLDYLHAAETTIKALSGDTLAYIKEYLGVSANDLRDLRKIYLSD